MKEIPFNEIEGLRVGHAQNLAGPTGVTVIISKAGAAVGVDVRGGAPGTRETDLLNPVNLVQEAHSVFLAGEAPSDWMRERASCSTWRKRASVLMCR